VREAGGIDEGGVTVVVEGEGKGRRERGHISDRSRESEVG